jgi:hypothetical protein
MCPQRILGSKNNGESKSYKSRPFSRCPLEINPPTHRKKKMLPRLLVVVLSLVAFATSAILSMCSFSLYNRSSGLFVYSDRNEEFPARAFSKCPPESWFSIEKLISVVSQRAAGGGGRRECSPESLIQESRHSSPTRV